MRNEVRARRDELGWSLDRLGRETGLTSEGIRQIELGNVIPRIDKARLLARALGVSLDELFPLEVEAATA